jgi:protease I
MRTSGCYPLRRINAPARLAAGNHRKAIKGSDPKAKISPLDHMKTATSSVGKGNAKDRDPPSQYRPLNQISTEMMLRIYMNWRNEMAQSIEGRKVAILATHGFEQAELTEPQKALKNAGATVHIVSPEQGSIRGYKHLDPADQVTVDRALSEAKADDYDALVIPGGLFNPDELRTNEAALQFVREFFKAGKPVGAICHGPQVLISADLVKGRTLTAVAPIRKDLTNAGAKVLDQEVVTDKGLVTSRTPKDLPAFCAKLIEEIGEGRHHGQATAAE